MHHTSRLKLPSAFLPAAPCLPCQGADTQTYFFQNLAGRSLWQLESKSLNDNFQMNVGRVHLFPLIYYINLSLPSHFNRKCMFPSTNYIDISVTVLAAYRDFPLLVYSLITTEDTDLAKYDIIS